MPDQFVDETPIVATEQLATTVDDEVVILHEASGTYYGLNEVGARIWELIQEPMTVQAVATAIAEEYEVSLDQCKQDVKTVCTDLAAADLIQVTDGSSA